MGKSMNMIVYQLREAGYNGEIPEGSTFMSLLKFQKEFYQKRMVELGFEVTPETTTAEMQKKIEDAMVKPTVSLMGLFSFLGD
jgi:hypothetical protein